MDPNQEAALRQLIVNLEANLNPRASLEAIPGPEMDPHIEAGLEVGPGQ